MGSSALKRSPFKIEYKSKEVLQLWIRRRITCKKVPITYKLTRDRPIPASVGWCFKGIGSSRLQVN